MPKQKPLSRKGIHKKKPIDYDRVEKLASMGLIVEEIAAVENVHPSTIQHNAEAMERINRGREMVKASVKRKQYEVAMQGDKTMLIWLGKQYCNQSDKVDQNVDQTHRYYISGPEKAESADEWRTQFAPTSHLTQ